jgi:ribosomal protein S18 acetylase RimI-like enzyme
MSNRRVLLERKLKPEAAPIDPRCRTVRPTDREDLAILLYAAYRGTIDDEGETFADALREIDKTFGGDYGSFLPEHSFVIEDGEFLASACLISWFEHHNAPLLVFLMTRPERKRQGLGRSVLTASMESLADAGFEKITLVVTEENEPASRLYEGLGFGPIPPKQT